MFKLFYGDSVLTFSGPGPGEITPEVVIPPGESFAKIVENLEKYKLCRIVSENPEDEFRRFMANFRRVDAAGGVVTGDGDTLLMISRNGRWDLPKGHREEGEDPLACAVREVREETGVEASAATVAPRQTETLHFYLLHGEWVMKHTRWYSLISTEPSAMRPQSEEGITAVEWVPRGEVAARARSCFPSVREVLTRQGWLTEVARQEGDPIGG